MQPSKIIQKRILITDDDEAVRQALKLLLTVDHHAVTEAGTGEEALDWLKRERFDLVITDLEMPGLKGNELAVRIRQQLPLQPILMITAYAERLLDVGNPVDAVLHKPFQFEDLRKTIAELLAPGGVPASVNRMRATHFT